MKVSILGTKVDNVTFDDATILLKKYLQGNKNNIIVTPNPEMIVLAKDDTEFREILNSASLCTADGIGVVYASRLYDTKIKERVCGFDMALQMIKCHEQTNASFYILGAGKGVALKAVQNLKNEYTGINILGCHDGYFDEEEEKEIIREICELKPDILILGLGMKKQEIFAHKYKNVLPCKITFCVGGTIDVLSGEVKRAPDIFIKLNLEWFYRLVKNPSRIVRMLKLPYFIILVLLEKFRGRVWKIKMLLLII